MTREHYKNQFTNMEDPVWKRIPLPVPLFVVPEDLPEDVLQCGDIREDRVDIRSAAGEAIPEAMLAGGSHRKTLGDKFLAFNQGYANSGYVIRSRQTRGEPVIRLHVHLDAAHPSRVEHWQIHAEAGARLTVILEVTGEAGVDLHHYQLTQVHVAPGATVRMVRVQMLPESAAHFQQHVSVVEDGGILEQVDIQLGAGRKAVAFESDLRGRHSRSEVRAVYMGLGSSGQDFSYTMAHQGVQSESLILAKGALDDHARKVFRGNLFFDTGAAGSRGREAEYVTMLSENVKADSIPALMCAEDDVVGEHAASVGRVDPDKLFYLTSRGLSAEEARRLLVLASFEEILEAIPDEALAGRVREAVERRLGA